MQQPQPVFCTVIEPQLNWVHAASLLIHSLRQRGGPYSYSCFKLFVVSQASSIDEFSVLHEDSQYRVSVVSSRREQPIPHLSKVRALSHPISEQHSHYVLLDHDTIILHLHGLSSFLTDAVHARRNYKYDLSRVLGRDYAVHLNSLPGHPWSRIHYFNSGVVVAPRVHAKQLGASWKEWANRLASPYQGHPLSEQLGFAMALADSAIPYEFLPVSFNQTNWRSPRADAAIAHYNSFDPTNKSVKEEALVSFENFRTFLNQTENRFWRQYRLQIFSLLTPDLDALAERLTSVIVSRQAGTA